jgi:hypothetical protein
MRPTLVDSNVIFDVAEGDPAWRVWSEAAIQRCLDESLLVINPIIYAEVSVGYRTIEEVEAVLPATSITESHCRTMRHFSPASRSSHIVGGAVGEQPRCPISISEPMRRCAVTGS